MTASALRDLLPLRHVRVMPRGHRAHVLLAALHQVPRGLARALRARVRPGALAPLARLEDPHEGPLQLLGLAGVRELLHLILGGRFGFTVCLL